MEDLSNLSREELESTLLEFMQANKELAEQSKMNKIKVGDVSVVATADIDKIKEVASELCTKHKDYLKQTIPREDDYIA